MISRRRFIAASVTAAVAGPLVMGAGRRREIRLGLVADPQFADIEPRRTRFYRQSIGKLKRMVETEDTNAFAVAQVHADRLQLVGHGREPSRELVFRSRA